MNETFDNNPLQGMGDIERPMAGFRNVYEIDHPFYNPDYDDERTEQKRIIVTELEIPPEISEKYSVLCELPQGVCVMGGVARSIAREILTGVKEPVRDVDLVAIEEFDTSNLDSVTMDQLSTKYMPDDYSHGHGMEYTTLEKYFTTRDFTVNQVLVIDGKLFISEQAVSDFRENIIRPTYYEMPGDNWDLSSKLVVKALLMEVVLEEVSSSVPTIEDMVVDNDRIDDFYLALGLNKAMDRGARTARMFVDSLIDWGLLDEEFTGRPKAAAQKLRTGNNFEYRPSSDVVVRASKRQDFYRAIHDLGGYYDDRFDRVVFDFHPTNQSVTKILGEEGYLESDVFLPLEPSSGRYGPNDYSDMNQ